jgi:RNA polymerase sigma-70 factor (ECF subfamily)
MSCTATQLSWEENTAAVRASRRKEYPKQQAKPGDRLVADAGRNETAAFEQLYEQTAPRVLKTLHRITRNREDAEDALQEAFMNAFIHAKDFDGRSSFTTWFTRIAINSALMILRKKRSHPEHSLDAGSTADESETRWVVPDTAPNPEKQYAQQERETILKAAVRDLRPTIRKAVEVGQLQDRSMRETADVLGISVAAAKARLFHARSALRRSRRIRSMCRLRFPSTPITVRAREWGRYA